ncbi:methyltransferase domain-containing protein [Patescibacteria group bacterium]|nr:methyltransferase domain-containing protein [Patescibacteria group bacterium]
MTPTFPDLSSQKYDIPFVPSLEEKVRIMVELAGPLQGKKTIDLGAGDGRVVIAFAQNGAEATGVEISPERVALARRNIANTRLNNKANILAQSFWETDLSEADVITLYGITSIMEKLEKKIESEAKPGTLIISNVFVFPHWLPVLQREGVYVYRPKSV